MGKSADRVTLEAITSQLKTSGAAFSARDALQTWMQEIAPYGIFTTDAELRVQSWNQWLAFNSGIPSESILGRVLTEVFPELLERNLSQYYDRAIGGEISVLSSALHKYLLAFPAKLRRESAPHMLQTARIAPLPSAAGLTGTVTIIEDVTERESHAVALHRQQEHDRLLSRVLEALLQSSRPLQAIADLFPEIGPSLGLEAFYHHRFDPKTDTLLLQASGGIPPKHKELMLRLPLGERFCGHCAATREPRIATNLQHGSDPLLESHKALGLRFYCCFPIVIADRLLGTIAFGSYSRTELAADELTFVTRLSQYIGIAMERSQREEELQIAQGRLREHADDLEVKVRERTARLHDTIAQLESFSYTVAHDLRAPIRALKGYCEVLEEEFGEHISSEGHFILNRLRRASTRLDALTRDLLDFSKITRQEVQLSPLNLDEVLEDLLVVSPILEKVVRVEAPLGPAVGHRTLLQQCLANLLDNAQKFRVPERELHITVRTESTEMTPGTTPPVAFSLPGSAADVRHAGSNKAKVPSVRIWIEDNGVGIAPELQRKVFGIFERGPGTEHVEGTGIGLAIVARAMQQMRGDCGVISEPGKGSRFWLELPTSPAAPREEHPLTPSAGR